MSSRGMRELLRGGLLAPLFALLLVLGPAPALGDCEPQCSGKICGDDGCGGSCGECGGKNVCVAGKCIHDVKYIPDAGCCDGDVLVRGVSQRVVLSPCGAMPSCGWDPGAWDRLGRPGAYACGTDGGEDPSGETPKPCEVDCAGACSGKECGPSDCWGDCGTCDEDEVCAEGKCCAPDCEGRECGDDGCGGSCGPDCPDGQGCSPEGMCCVHDCDGKQCGPDGCGGSCGYCEDGLCLEGVCVSGCSGIQVQGCCSGGDVVYCTGSKLVMLPCSEQAQCGWKPLPGAYFCGQKYSGDEDPSGTYPIDCELDCSQNCIGKECGSDGCGDGTCGECHDGDVCFGGLCCTPDCDGKTCGDDGCGGSCGECQPGTQDVCEDGQCVDAFGCKVTSAVGCPGCACEECVCAAEPACCLWEWSWDCVWLCEEECGGCLECVPDCDGAVCGSDGCGGSCGDCLEGYWCAAGACCEQDCQGKECGDDGCGGSCGTCPSGAVCGGDFLCEQLHGCGATGTPGCGGCACEDCVCAVDEYCCDIAWDALCVSICQDDCGGCGPDVCTSFCEGKECGDDGCAGSCGDCPDGDVCDGGQCCTPDCQGGCGGPDGCGGTCGPELCGLGSYCEDGQCVSLCADECDGLECGVGRCGGPCGAQGEGCPQWHQICVEGTCYNDCGGMSPLAGCCDGAVSYQCSAVGSSPYLQVVECNDCGWIPEYDTESEYETGFYWCASPQPDPEGVHPWACGWTCKGPVCDSIDDGTVPMECGPDGCGGTCGDCAVGAVCDRGRCCDLDMAGRDCGPDGCGGIVECPAGQRCDGDGACVACGENPCQELACGPDGCGGWCGTCPEGEVCAGGDCLDACQGLSPKGCCSGDILIRCKSTGWIEAEKCGPGANYCGWDPDAEDAAGEPGAYACNTTGYADPAGQHPLSCGVGCVPACWWKECGDDGCGGSCGDCADGASCEDGVCVSDPGPDVVSSEDSSIEVEVTEPGDGVAADAVDSTDGSRRRKGCSVGAPVTCGEALGLLLLLMLGLWGSLSLRAHSSLLPKGN